MVSRENRFQNRLPPKVLSRKKTGKKGNKSSKRRKKPWYRHTPWMISLVACGIFIVLIGGVYGVRQVVILVRGSHSEVAAEDNGSTADSAERKESVDQDLAASLQSSEPGMEVLPPKAAKQPGRKLPKMLLVGRRPEMFQSLKGAMKVALPGDIIEIRTSRPMLVGSCELKVEKRIKGVPLTIRAGKGFQPVLRAAKDRVIAVDNVNLKVIGIHFTTQTRTTCLNVKNGNVVVEQCSFTSISPHSGGIALGVWNTKGPGYPLTIEINRCLIRGKRMVGIKGAGPSMGFALNQSAFLGNGHDAAVYLVLDDDQSVDVKKCTFLGSSVLAILVGGDGWQWPSQPLTFRMDGSIFAARWRTPMLLRMELPASYRAQGLAVCEEAVRQSFESFQARNNFAHYFSTWAVISNGPDINTRLFKHLPESDQTLRFSPRVEAAIVRVFKVPLPLDALDFLSAVLPSDLVVKSTGPLAERMKDGQRYGCDLTQLPVPPPSTLQPYKIPNQPVPNKKK